MTHRVMMTAQNGAVLVRPAGRLDTALFRLYVTACHAGGARYDKAARAQRAIVERAGALALALEQAGFRVEAPSIEPAQIEAARARRDSLAVDSLAATLADLDARGLRPYPYQLDGIEWLAPRAGALLADEMGLGKTIQAILALPRRSRVVVVCPAAVKGVWLSEFRRWRPEYLVTVLSGRGSFRWPMPGQAVVLNYDILPEQAGLPPAETVLIADEAHALKSKRATRTKRANVLARAVRRAGGRVWPLTGTPLVNKDPHELWNVLDFAGLAEDAFDSWPNFMRLCNAKKGRFGIEWGTPSPEVAIRLRRVMLRRRRLDVLPQLPTKTRKDISVTDLPHETRKICDEALEVLRRKGIDLASAHALVDLTKIQGPGFELIAKARAALAVAKMGYMEEIVEEYEEQGEPLVVFSAHRAPIDSLAARPGWAVITGEVKPDERSAIVERFQRGELKGVGITIRAGGLGITLTHAAHALFVDLEWTPSANSQAEDRLCRIGQDRGCLITRLIAAHALDARVVELLDIKQTLFDATVAAPVDTLSMSSRPTIEAGSVNQIQANQGSLF